MSRVAQHSIEAHFNGRKLAETRDSYFSVGDGAPRLRTQMVDWKNRKALTASCVGDMQIPLNHDQTVQLRDADKTPACGERVMYQVGPILAGLEYEAFNTCPHNEAFA